MDDQFFGRITSFWNRALISAMSVFAVQIVSRYSSNIGNRPQDGKRWNKCQKVSRNSLRFRAGAVVLVAPEALAPSESAKVATCAILRNSSSWLLATSR